MQTERANQRRAWVGSGDGEEGVRIRRVQYTTT